MRRSVRLRTSISRSVAARTVIALEPERAVSDAYAAA
jgi:hypothetical protein